MSTLRSVEAILRPLQGRDEHGFYPRYLFRGQTKHHGNITPFISRRLCPEAKLQVYRMMRDASIFATGIGGYTVNRRDGIGLLQHYGIPTPFIDFTGTLDVAMFFALLNTQPGNQS